MAHAQDLENMEVVANMKLPKPKFRRKTTPQNVEAGSPVVTSDNKEVGRVHEARDEEVRVGSPGIMDFWLESSHINSEQDKTAQLDLTEAELNDLRERDPTHLTKVKFSGPQ
jgi:hypothetical protein